MGEGGENREIRRVMRLGAFYKGDETLHVSNAPP